MSLSDIICFKEKVKEGNKRDLLFPEVLVSLTYIYKQLQNRYIIINSVNSKFARLQRIILKAEFPKLISMYQTLLLMKLFE
jgi:hypothetical protein